MGTCPSYNTSTLDDGTDNDDDDDDSSSSTSWTFGGTSTDANLFDFDTRINIGGLNAELTLSMESIQLLNLNTMSTPMELIEPIEREPYQLNNTMTMGFPIDDDRPMSVAINRL